MTYRTGIASRRRVAAASRVGLTLLELIIVLAILVALATVAAQSVEPRINQSRYEATQQTLENIHAAILGDPNARQSDGTPLISGFVADLGTLPNSLDELVLQGNFPDLTIQSAENHPEVQLSHGWRGPYLQLTPTATAIRDGWGRELAFTRNSSVVHITSFGSDGIDDATSPPTDSYMHDQHIELHLVTVSGNVVDTNGDPVPAATVTLYLPQLGEQHLLEVNDSDGNTNATFQFNGIPPGTRVIRAEASDASATMVGVQYLQVPRTGLMNVVITVR